MKNVKLSKTEIAENLNNIFNMLDSKCRISKDGSIRINCLNVSIEAMRRLVELNNSNPKLIPFVKRSGFGVVVIIRDLQD